MATKTGTVKLVDTGTTKTLIVKDSPDQPFTDPPGWVWDLVKGNAGAEVTIVYEGDPVVFTSVTVG